MPQVQLSSLVKPLLFTAGVVGGTVGTVPIARSMPEQKHRGLIAAGVVGITAGGAALLTRAHGLVRTPFFGAAVTGAALGIAHLTQHSGHGGHVPGSEPAAPAPAPNSPAPTPPTVNDDDHHPMPLAPLASGPQPTGRPPILGRFGTPPQGPIDPGSIVPILRPDPNDRGPNAFASSARARLEVVDPTSAQPTTQQPVTLKGQTKRANNAYRPRPGDLLPDLRPLFPNQIGLLTSANNKRILQFSSTWVNQGEAPLEMRFQPGENTGVRQRIYSSDGSSRDVKSQSTFDIDQRTDHRHAHLRDFAKYELFKANEDGTVGARVRKNDKVSFYITDTDALMPRLDPNGYHRVDRRSKTGEVVHGISVGWGDTYGAVLQGQSFDVTGLPVGDYILRMSFDPSDRIAEGNEQNNSYDTLVRIGASNNAKPRGILSPRTRPADGGPSRLPTPSTPPAERLADRP